MKILLFLLGWNSVFAAASLVHLFIAEQFLQFSKPAMEIEVRDFYLGNVFPDIRYLGNVGRDETHEFGLGLKDVVQSSSPFRAGMRLHSYVDELRENLVLEWKIYDRLEGIDAKHQCTFLKLLESEILYDQTDPESFIPFFNELIEDEINYGVPIEDHHTSHRFIVEHLVKRPSVLFLEYAKQGAPFFKFSPAIVQLWSRLLPQLAQEEYFRNYVRDLIGFFNGEFGKYTLSLPKEHPIRVLESKETEECWISIIEDSEGKKSVVKQMKGEEVSANQGIVIPPGVPFPGKKFVNRPATLQFGGIT